MGGGYGWGVQRLRDQPAVLLRICLLWSTVSLASLASSAIRAPLFPSQVLPFGNRAKTYPYSELAPRLEVQKRCHPSLVGIRVWSPPAMGYLLEVSDDHSVALRGFPSTSWCCQWTCECLSQDLSMDLCPVGPVHRSTSGKLAFTPLHPRTVHGYLADLYSYCWLEPQADLTPYSPDSLLVNWSVLTFQLNCALPLQPTQRLLLSLSCLGLPDPSSICAMA